MVTSFVAPCRLLCRATSCSPCEPVVRARQARDARFDLRFRYGRVTQDESCLPRWSQKVRLPAVHADAERRGAGDDLSGIASEDAPEPQEDVCAGGAARPGHLPRVEIRAKRAEQEVALEGERPAHASPGALVSAALHQIYERPLLGGRA